MGKKRNPMQPNPPYWARKHLDGEWMRVPLRPGSDEVGVALCPDPAMARRLTAQGPVVPIREPVEGEPHAVVITAEACWSMPMAEAFVSPESFGWWRAEWLEHPQRDADPIPENVLGFGVLLLSAAGRGPEEIAALHAGMPSAARFGRQFWRSAAARITAWAEGRAGRPIPAGLLEHLGRVDPENAGLHASFASALLSMAVGQEPDDAASAAWVRREGSLVAAWMAEGG